MGDLVDLAHYRADRSRQNAGEPAAVFFDLGSPFSYLAAERVERMLGDVEWVPTAPVSELTGVDRLEAERQARALRLPLVWPEGDLHFRLAARAAAYASEVGRAGQFVLAASRLAFCGGFDLDEPEILAEAASAAGIAPSDALEAAADPEWDEQLDATACGLRRRGVDRLPAVLIGGHWRSGERALGEAAALMSAAAEGSSQALGRS